MFVILKANRLVMLVASFYHARNLDFMRVESKANFSSVEEICSVKVAQGGKQKRRGKRMNCE